MVFCEIMHVRAPISTKAPFSNLKGVFNLYTFKFSQLQNPLYRKAAETIVKVLGFYPAGRCSPFPQQIPVLKNDNQV